MKHTWLRVQPSLRFPVGVVLVFWCALVSGIGHAKSAASQSAADTTIVVRASSSSLEYDPPAIAAKAGTRVRLRFINSGTLPHNFVLVKDEADIDALAAEASKAGGDYVPLSLKGKMIAYSTLASPGQTVEIVFVVPPAGAYTYVCLLSGHSNSMLGSLRSLR